MTNCENCGEKLNKGDKFCEKCGFEVTKESKTVMLTRALKK